MGYGTGKKDMPKIEGIAMAGKMHGGGVKLDRNNVSNSEKQVLAGAFNSFGQAKVISGGHPKAGFMHKSKSMGNPKGQGYNDRQDEALGVKDGKESGKKQSMKDRRDESEGENKSLGNKPDGFAK